MAQFRRLRLAAIVIASWLALSGRASSQALSEPALKAAFLYNFTKFTAWPAETTPPGAALTLCAIGDGAIVGMLQQIVTGHPIDGHDVKLVAMAADGPLRTCHVLYLAGDDARRDGEVLERVKTAPVLTVGETDRFARTGGVARLFVDGGKMRFAINVDAAQRAHLRISSKVLALGVVVRDENSASR